MDSVITDTYALYHADCVQVMKALPDRAVDLSIYSPPFGGLYNYSSAPEDLSNCLNLDEFLEHYAFVIDEIARLTKPGRITAVHCSDIPKHGLGSAEIMLDLPGLIIGLHEKRGFDYSARFCIWKEPLGVRNRTMAKKLAHRQTVDDSTLAMNAGADYLLVFRRHGKNTIPVTHHNGFLEYAGASEIPEEFRPFRGWSGDQKQNLFSHWIWRRYASSIWDDIREDHVLPFKQARDEEDERHIHPLQLDLIERAIVMWSNEGETVLTPFLGIGSEAFVAVELGRRAIGAELKETYFRQAVRNLEACQLRRPEQLPLFNGSRES